MLIDYNEGNVAELYKEAKKQPWRSRIEAFTFLKHIGDLAGKKVVDIACGEGHFTRKLKQLGADKVMGVDIAQRMIDLAQHQENDDPLGIEFHVADARLPVNTPTFDLAVSAWLLVYADHRPEALQMCQGVASYLRPGGRFVTFTTNPDLYHFQPRADYSKYGFTIEVEDKPSDGAPILWKAHFQGQTLQIDNYYLPLSTYQACLEEAGFRDVTVHGLELDPSFGDDPAYWQYFLDYPPAIVIEAVKA